MSHFSVLVIGEDHEAQLAPFHEFECTGRVDEYVQTVDKTEEARATYVKDTTRMLKLVDGTLVSPYVGGNYNPGYLRPPTIEEREAIQKAGPLGLGGKPPFETVGYGDSVRVVQFPAGAEDIQVPTVDHESFAEWAAGYYGAPIAHGMSEVDLDDTHKYGYTLVEVDSVPSVQVFDRTNPNRKWDWYSVGGRWTGYFKVKAGADAAVGDPGILTEPAEKGWADVCLKGDIDIVGMRAEAMATAAENFDRIHAILDDRPLIEPWDHVRVRFTEQGIDAARKFYNAQEGLVALREAKESVWNIEPFLVQRDEFIETARQNALVPFALVMDGQWFESGSMGWWGMVSDEKNQAEWMAMVNQLLDGLPDGTLITAVDCHI